MWEVVLICTCRSICGFQSESNMRTCMQTSHDCQCMPQLCQVVAGAWPEEAAEQSVLAYYLTAGKDRGQLMHRVSGLEVEAEAASACGQEEDEVGAVLCVEIRQHPRPEGSP